MPRIDGQRNIMHSMSVAIHNRFMTLVKEADPAVTLIHDSIHTTLNQLAEQQHEPNKYGIPS